MKKTKVLTLIVVFVGLLALLIVVDRESSNRPTAKLATEGIDSSDISKILISKGSERVEVIKSAKGSWILPQKSDFAASITKINSLILRFVSIKLDQFVTNIDQNFADLGVSDESYKEGKTMVQFFNSQGKELSAYLLGNEKIQNTGSKSSIQMMPKSFSTQQYFRVKGSKDVYLLPDTLSYDAESSKWIDSIVLNVFQHNLVKVKIEDGKIELLAERVEKEENKVKTYDINYKLSGLSEGEEVDKVKAGQLMLSLESLEAVDVYKSSDEIVTNLSFKYSNIYFENNGLVYTIQFAKNDKDELFVKVAVNFDSEYKIDDSVKNPALKLSSKEEAEKLNNRLSNWVFKISEFQKDRFKLVKSALLASK